MNRYSLPKQLDMIPAADRIIAVGMFDGVHIGHRAVLTRALLRDGLSPAVFTFSYTPDKPKNGLSLQSAEGRQNALEAMGFADLFEADFAAMRSMTAAEFVVFLKEALHARAIVCGFNFRFGRGGAGDTALLQTLCEQNGLELQIVPPVESDGKAVSSTRIKEALLSGDMETVQRLLGKPFTVCTPVISGNRLGHTLGAPTINQPLSPDMQLPRFGVYASVVLIGRHSYIGVTNIGIKPTVGGMTPLAETFILHFDGDLYGQTVTVQCIHFLRPETTFRSLDDLRRQIAADAAATESFFSPAEPTTRAVLFDFDDTLTHRDRSFACFCRAFLKKHFPQLSPVSLDTYGEELTVASAHGYRPFDRTRFFEVCHAIDPHTMLAFEDFLSYMPIGYPLGILLTDDALSTLSQLRRAGFRLGLVTNGDTHTQNRKLDFAGVRPFFDCVTVADDEGIAKPDAEIFRRAALRLGTAPKNCVFVGDNPINDIAGAAAVGMRPIFVDHGYPGFAVDDGRVPHIRKLCELPALLSAATVKAP